MLNFVDNHVPTFADTKLVIVLHVVAIVFKFAIVIIAKMSANKLELN